MEGTHACIFDNAELSALARGNFSSSLFELIFSDENAISFCCEANLEAITLMCFLWKFMNEFY